MNSNYDPMYRQGNSMPGPNPSTWGQPYTWQPQLNTNITYVTSLEEAMMRTNNRGSDMLYFHQDKNVFYRIKVDIEGRKSWAEFEYNVPNKETNIPATKADIDALAARVESLEKDRECKATPKKKINPKEATDNAEFNG